jgi:hypothetical protein
MVIVQETSTEQTCRYNNAPRLLIHAPIPILSASVLTEMLEQLKLMTWSSGLQVKDRKVSRRTGEESTTRCSHTHEVNGLIVTKRIQCARIHGVAERDDLRMVFCDDPSPVGS